MLQGTGSSVGKSLLVAGIGRALTRRGLRVAPFKPQNMSNNAAVTVDGGEIGRAQALQARACRAAPHSDMNPVLLKPQEGGSQVVVHGRLWRNAGARAYQSLKPGLMPRVLESFSRLAASHDVVLVEGAGSASEVNLRAGDIANMGFSRAASVPVVLVGDIDRGGVIASLVGTRHVLAADDAAMIRGFVVNRMRGDISLFADGMGIIAEATGWPALGLVPHFAAASRLPREDSLDLVPTRASRAGEGARIRIAVPLLPSIANVDDLDPLDADPAIELLLLDPAMTPLPGDCDLVILPGSKSVRGDLACLFASGWDVDLAAHRRRGGRILGLCGGLQMLGRSIADPEGVEGASGETRGLGMLDVETVLTGYKRLTEVRGVTLPDRVPVAGYEMHVGRTAGADCARPFAELEDGTMDGARSPDGRVAGTYLHGIFASAAQRARLTGAVLPDHGGSPHDEEIERVLDSFADHLEAHLDLDAILALAGGPT